MRAEFPVGSAGDYDNYEPEEEGELSCREGGVCVALVATQTRWGVIWVCDECGSHSDDDETEHHAPSARNQTKPYG